MVNHPFISDLSGKSADELLDTINNLNRQLQFVYRMGKQDMVNQISMAISSYKDEYAKRQQAMWNSKNQGSLDKKIDIS